MSKLMRENKIKNKDSCDVVLLQLPLWGVGFPPLSLGLLKAYLEQNGISCKIIDINAHAYATKGKKYLEYWHVKNGYNYRWERKILVEFYRNYRPIILYYMDEIRKANPLIVGCTVMDTSRVITEFFLEDLRKNVPGINHVLGGPGVAHFMKNTDQLLSCDYVDAVCQDEGEKSLIDYFNAIKNNTGLPVPGMVYKKEGKILKGPPSMYTGKLDTLPYPNFEGIHLMHYPDRTLPTYSSRGCVNKCNYCSAIGFMTNKRYPFRMRSAQRMFDEVVYLYNKFPEVEEFRMADNISNGKISALIEFCDLMISSGMNKKVKWSLENAVIRKEMRKPLYDKLKEAGCVMLGYGMETPTDRLLKEVGKTLAVQKGVDLPAILKEGREAGLFINANIMFGLPGETEEDFDYLMKFLKDNKKAFSMINPSLNFTEYYPGASGHEDPKKIGVDLSKGDLMWDSTDGKNTYLTRMARFEKFTRLAKKFGIANLFQIEELENKHRLLFEYYYKSNDSENAKKEYHKINKNELSEEIEAKYLLITTGDRSALDKYIEKDKRNRVIKLEDYLSYRGNLEDNFIGEPLSDLIDDFVELKPYDREYAIANWKHNVRKFTLAITGFYKIEYLIIDILLAFKKIDKALILVSDSLENGNKFITIEKAVNDLRLLINKIDKIINNFFSRSTKKINKSFYYYEKINKMLKLFVKAFKTINNNKADLSVDNLSNNTLNSITKELSQLLNSKDKNENKIFSNSFLESKLFALYIRVVGYKSTERGIAILHTVMTLLIRKMLRTKNKSSTLDISNPALRGHGADVVDSNPISAANHTDTF